MKTTDIVIVIGRKGSGKSYLIKHLFLPQFNSYVIDDHVMERTRNEYADFGYRARYLAEIVSKPRVNYDDSSFEKIWNALKAHANRWGDTLFVIDEAHIHFAKKSLPTAQKEVLHENRHYGTGIILASQRIYDINPIAYKQADYIILFYTREPREIEFIRKYISSEVAETVKTLKQYYFVLFDVNNQRVRIHKPI
jgi:DNA helicase HerA-like ATPase